MNSMVKLKFKLAKVFLALSINTESNHNILAVVGIIFLALIAMRDLFLPGFYESHDGIIHVMRLAHFYSALHQGQIVVRWLSTWMAGYGSPLFIFNWSLPYYFGSLFHWLGYTLEQSIKMVFIFGYLVSGLTMYLFLKQMLRNTAASFVGALLYVWAPYRFADIFIRGALGEATSFIFLPLLFWIVLTLWENKKYRHIYLFSFIIALSILNHNIMSLIGLIASGAFVLYLFLTRNIESRVLIKSLTVFILGISLTAYFWLPAVVEKKFDTISRLAILYPSGSQFPSLTSLISSRWQYGEAIPSRQNLSMPFEIGLVHVILPLGAIFLYVKKKIKKRNKIIARFFILLFLFSIFMAIDASALIYQIHAVSSAVNFPWRFLEIIVFSASVLSAIFLHQIKKHRIIIMFAVTFVTIVFYFSYSRIVSFRYSLSDTALKERLTTTKMTLPDVEFLPSGADYYSLLKDRGKSTDHTLFEGIDNAIEVVEMEKRYNFVRAILTTDTPTQVRINTFYFPGWEITVQNQPVMIKKDKYGLILFDLPKGVTNIILTFQETPVRKVANSISIIILSFIVMYIFILRLKTKKTIKDFKPTSPKIDLR